MNGTKGTSAVNASPEGHFDSHLLIFACWDKCSTCTSFLLNRGFTAHRPALSLDMCWEFPSKIQLKHCIAIDCSALTSSFPLQWLTDHTQHTGQKRASSMQRYCCLAPAPKALPTCLFRFRPVWPQGNHQKKHCAEDGSLHWFISLISTLAFTLIYSNPSLLVFYPPSKFQGNHVGSRCSTKI